MGMTFLSPHITTTAGQKRGVGGVEIVVVVYIRIFLLGVKPIVDSLWNRFDRNWGIALVRGPRRGGTHAEWKQSTTNSTTVTGQEVK
jgi:hypothetical protein